MLAILENPGHLKLPSKLSNIHLKRFPIIHVTKLNTQIIIGLKDFMIMYVLPEGWHTVPMAAILKLVHSRQSWAIRKVAVYR